MNSPNVLTVILKRRVVFSFILVIENYFPNLIISQKNSISTKSSRIGQFVSLLLIPYHLRKSFFSVPASVADNATISVHI